MFYNQKVKGMTSYQIKLIAASLMVVDHIGVVFFPDQLAFRYIGRLSFPLFAWLIGQGEKYTKNFNSYLIRLAVWAGISQPLYYALFNSSNLNILVTLLIGLLAIKIGKVVSFKYLVWFTFAGLAQAINTSFGFYGILTITVLSEFNSNDFKWWLQWILVNLLVLAIPGSEPYQLLAVLAPLIIMLRNGKQGQKAKLFYFFYPVHLFILKLLVFLLLAGHYLMQMN
jgi:TraX protein